MKLGMGSVGAGGLIWLVATACGETKDGSDQEPSSNGSGGSASSTSSTGTETGADTDAASGAMGSSTVGSGTQGVGTTGTGTTETSAVGSGSMGAGGTSSSNCPDVEPPLGASCADDGLSCTFTNCAAPNYRNDHTLSCVQGAWTLASEVECLANCPETPPVIGSPCQTEETPGPCAVENECGMAEAYCVDDEWSLNPSAEDRAPEPPDGAGGSSGIIGEPLCPETAPDLYSDCCPAHTPEYCDYAGGSGSGLVPPETTTSTTGAQGSGGTMGTTGGTGGTGGTGASGLCLACDPTRMEWVVSGACN